MVGALRGRGWGFCVCRARVCRKSQGDGRRSGRRWRGHYVYAEEGGTRFRPGSRPGIDGRHGWDLQGTRKCRGPGPGYFPGKGGRLLRRLPVRSSLSEHAASRRRRGRTARGQWDAFVRGLPCVLATHLDLWGVAPRGARHDLACGRARSGRDLRAGSEQLGHARGV